jgi:type II secretory pathway pseudopilin PulG
MLKNRQMKTQGTTRGGKAFTLIELLLVGCLIALLVAVILATLNQSQHREPRITCINNLKEIGLAFRIWEGDNGDKYPMQVSVTNGGAMELADTGNVVGIFRAISNELATPKFLYCPEDTKHSEATNFTTDFDNRKISYFVSLDANDTYPQMIFSGDDNFAINGFPVKSGLLGLWTNSSLAWTSGRHVSYNSHFWTAARYRFVGNIGLADGSVQQTTSLELQQAIQYTSVATNRIVIP